MPTLTPDQDRSRSYLLLQDVYDAMVVLTANATPHDPDGRAHVAAARDRGQRALSLLELDLLDTDERSESVGPAYTFDSPARSLDRIVSARADSVVAA